MKPMIVFIKKTKKKKNFHGRNQNGRLKKRSFSSTANFHFFFFFQELVLGLVGLIDAKGIDVAQPVWS